MQAFRPVSVAAFVLWVLLGLAGTALAAEKAELRGTGRFEIPGWFKSSFLVMPEDVAEAAHAGKRLLVYFGQDGCPYCAQLFNTNFSQPHILDYTRQHFDAIAIDIWGNREVTDFQASRCRKRNSPPA